MRALGAVEAPLQRVLAGFVGRRVGVWVGNFCRTALASDERPVVLRDDGHCHKGSEDIAVEGRGSLLSEGGFCQGKVGICAIIS